MDAQMKDVFDLAYKNALERGARVNRKDIDFLNYAFEVALGKKNSANFSVEAGKLDSMLLALESINSICEAKVYSEGLEFFPVRHSVFRNPRRKSMVTIKLKAGEAKFKAPNRAKSENLGSAATVHAAHETAAQLPDQLKKEMPSVREFAEAVNSTYEKIAEHYKRLGREKYDIEFKVPEIKIFSDDSKESDNESKFMEGILGYYKGTENTIHLTKALYEKYFTKNPSVQNEEIGLTLAHELGHAFAMQTGYDKAYKLRGKFNGSGRLRDKEIRDRVAAEFLANIFGARIELEIKGAFPTNTALVKELVNQAAIGYVYKDTEAAKIYLDALLKSSKELMDKHAEIRAKFRKDKRSYTDNGGEIDLGYFKTYLLEATVEASKHLEFIKDSLSALEIYGGPVLGAAKALENGIDFDKLVSKAAKNIKSLKYVKEYFPSAAAVEYSNLYLSFDLFGSLGPYMRDVLGLRDDQNKNLNPEKRVRDELEKCGDAIDGMEKYFKKMERVSRDIYENEKRVLGEMERIRDRLNDA